MQLLNLNISIIVATINQSVKLIYKAENLGKFKGTVHYKLHKGCLTGTPFTQPLNLSTNQGFARSMPKYWIRIRENNKWSVQSLTGLFYCKESIYKGDYNKKQNLILFKFSDDMETLTIYFFKGFFTEQVQQLINQL